MAKVTYTSTVPRVLLFDIDMTLIRTAGAGRWAMERAFEQEFGIEHATEGISFDGRTDRGIFIECLERHGYADGAVDDILARFCDCYLAFLPESLEERGGIILAGVPALLGALAREDVVLGLATGNLRRGAELKLEHFGIWKHFLGGGFGDDHVVRGELVRAGIAELAALQGCEPADCDVIVLGDTPLDVEAAHVAGARAVGVATGRFSAEALLTSGAEFAVQDLSDTAAMLEILVRG